MDFESKQQWFAEAKRLRSTGLEAKEVAAQVGEYSDDTGRFSIHNSGSSGVVAIDMEKRKARGAKRSEMERRQSLGIGDTEMPRNTTDKSKRAEFGAGKGQELHHRNSLIQNTPFYEGLSDDEAREFTSWAKDQGWSLGNADDNTNINLSTSEHKGVHAWMRENDIEGAKGPQARLMERFKGYDLEQRKSAFRDYMHFVQGAVDEHMAETLGDKTVSAKHTAAQTKNAEVVKKGVAEAADTGLKASRSRALKLAGVGLAGVSVLGTAASAAETTERTNIARQTNNPMDWVQAGLSGLSLATDFIPVAGELVSTPADAANVMIDQHRAGGSQMKGSGRGGGVRTAKTGTNKGPKGRSSAKLRKNKLTIT